MRSFRTDGAYINVEPLAAQVLLCGCNAAASSTRLLKVQLPALRHIVCHCSSYRGVSARRTLSSTPRRHHLKVFRRQRSGRVCPQSFPLAYAAQNLVCYNEKKGRKQTTSSTPTASPRFFKSSKNDACQCRRGIGIATPEVSEQGRAMRSPWKTVECATSRKHGARLRLTGSRGYRRRGRASARAGRRASSSPCPSPAPGTAAR